MSRHGHLTPVPADGAEVVALPSDITAERAVLGAMLLSKQACDDASQRLQGSDFYQPRHETIYSAAIGLYARLQPVDAITVGDELTRTGDLARVGGQTYLHQLIAAVPVASNAGHYAEIVADRSARRRIIQAGQAVAAIGSHDAGIDELLERAVAEVERARVQIPGLEPAAPGETLSQLLDAEEDDEPVWLAPGFLERQDRLILTAAEGAGKSTLLRQWAVQLAAGLHPFTLQPIKPVRVLYVDLENSRRQTRRKLRALRAAAPKTFDERNLVIICKTDGLDLTEPSDRLWLDAAIGAHHPDLLITGPIYKLAAGNPNDEVDAKPAAMAIDALRVKHDLAVILEAHQKKSPDGKDAARSKEPFGWSGWMRWPEFGIHLAKDGTITHWRGMREERQFPGVMRRGGRWPWTPSDSPNMQRFAMISDACMNAGRMLTQRELASTLGMSLGSVNHVLGEYAMQWAALRGRVEQGAER